MQDPVSPVWMGFRLGRVGTSSEGGGRRPVGRAGRWVPHHGAIGPAPALLGTYQPPAPTHHLVMPSAWGYLAGPKAFGTLIRC